MIYHLRILLCVLFINSTVAAQSLPRLNGDTSKITDTRLVSSYIRDVNSKVDHIDQKLDKYMAKALAKVKKQEDLIRRKLAKTDSLRASAVFGNAEEQYKRLEQQLQKVNSIQHYIPAYDTVFTALKFLQQSPQLNAIAKESGNLKETLSQINNLGSRFEKAEEIKIFLKERRRYLKDQLQHPGFAKELKKLNKQVFYYSEHLNNCKEILKDHKKAERKALELLSKTKIFQKFMQKNSMLASLFRLPADADDPSSAAANLSGLQTRAGVNNLIQQQIANGGPNAMQQFQQNIQQAQSQLSQIKSKIEKTGLGSSDAEMPEGFKKNNQRVKSFWKKWEAGFNIQSNRSNGVFPVSSDVGLSVGFRPHDNFVVGLGFAGRIGWGKNIRHINFTYSGISVRSFSELKIKGTFHAVAGFEMNYRPEIRTIEQLKDKSGWQLSGLVGLSKVVSLKTKFFKKTKLQILWDFMSYEQVPRTQPILFRIGYSF